MSLSVDEIRSATDDEALFNLLSESLKLQFPAELQEDRNSFLSALASAPRGLRAMAGIYDLDVSMSLDDLAWHFANHSDERFLQETVAGLKELEAMEAADIFQKAWDIVKPFLPEIRAKEWQDEDPAEYFEGTGIQSKIDPLNDRMWAICKECGDRGLLNYWLAYSRKYPERCVNQL